MRTPHASSAALVAGIVVATLAPVAAAGEDPTTGRCDGLGVPLPMEIGLVCALAGLGTNASCPPSSTVPMSVSCTSTYSWSWLAYSRVHLPGDVTVTIRHDVETCVDLVDAPPACTNHPGSSTVTCAWDVDGECRGSGRVDESWGPVALGMGEQFKVLVHIDIAMHARSNAAGVPVGDVEYGDFSDAGAAVEVVDNGRG